MEEKINPNYYSILPANIRYDKEIDSTSKIIYSEITALSNSYGYCNAKNKYFSSLYGLTEIRVSQIVNKLLEKKYVTVKFIKGDRRIYLAEVKEDETKKSLKELMQENILTQNDGEKEQLEEFYNYGTEKNIAGKKEKWQMQKTFDVKRRWGNGIKNAKKWNIGDKEKIEEIKKVKKYYYGPEDDYKKYEIFKETKGSKDENGEKVAIPEIFYYNDKKQKIKINGKKAISEKRVEYK